MYRIIISGKTPSELQRNLMALALEIDPQPEPSVDIPEPYKAPKTLTEKVIEDEASKFMNAPTPFPIPDGLPPVSMSAVQPQPVATPSVAPQFPISQGLPSRVGNQTDKRGVPWDERIHSSSKAMNADGSWRSRRGIAAEVIDQVEAQSKMGTVPTVPATPAAPPFVAPVLAAVPPPIAQPAPIAAPVYENIPVPPPQVTKPAHSLETFKANFIATIAGLVNTGKVTQEYIRQICDYFKVAEIYMVMKDDVKTAELFNTFCEAGLITRIG